MNKMLMVIINRTKMKKMYDEEEEDDEEDDEEDVIVSNVGQLFSAGDYRRRHFSDAFFLAL